jgi:NitT/TauT family transport system substrate-binding protein
MDGVARGEVDFTWTFAAPLLIAIDRGVSITLLAGGHVGCFELFGNEGVRSIADLKGKTVGRQALGSSQHVFAAAMAAYVGLDPARDIRWVINPKVKPTKLYEKGQLDAFVGFRRNPRICALDVSVTWSSTAPRMAVPRRAQTRAENMS